MTQDIAPALRISSFYQPTAKQWEFHSSPAMYRAQIGGFGGGKTRAGLMEAIRYALTIPGCNCLIIRRTHKELEKTIVNLLLNPSPSGINVPLEDLGAHYNKNEHTCYFQHAAGVTSKIVFGYCDEGKDIGQYLSTEYVFIFIEEAGEFPFTVWKELTGRNRCPVKTDLFGRPVRATIALATNPMGVGYGWIKKLFVDKQPTGGMSLYNAADYGLVHSTLFDNPVYATDRDYIAKLEALPEAERQKKLYGDLNAVSGLYFTNFISNPEHVGSQVVPYNSITFQKWHPRWLGIDWGFIHALAVIFFARADIMTFAGVKKTVTVAYDELIVHQKSEKEVVQAIAKRSQPGVQYSNVFLSHDAFGNRNASRTIAQQLGDELIRLNMPQPTRADSHKGARESGWKLAYNLFDVGDLLIADTCPQLINAIQLLTRDPDNIEDVLKTETEEDDIADGFRYGLKGYLAPGTKPLEDELNEKLEAAGSNTERFMMQQRFEQDHRGNGQLSVNVPKRRLW